MPSMTEICADLRAEHDALDAIVAGLDDGTWNTPTPAEGWTVRDQISHLSYFDDCATVAAMDPDAFKDWRDNSAMSELARTDGDPADIALGRSLWADELLARWRQGRAQMLTAFEVLDAKARIPWFGPDMSAASFATARLMETWAHGQDVADALGVERESTDRLKHICYIGIRALPYAYSVNKRELPSEPLRVEVKSPSGELWTWGPDDASNVVRGTALDLALLVIQRRHRDDTDLQATGPAADEWLSIAQAFAGPPGSGRKPGQFPKR
jgi:uncharacterized protein (TIGR03084 family)